MPEVELTPLGYLFMIGLGALIILGISAFERATAGDPERDHRGPGGDGRSGRRVRVSMILW